MERCYIYFFLGSADTLAGGKSYSRPTTITMKLVTYQLAGVPQSGVADSGDLHGFFMKFTRKASTPVKRLGARWMHMSGRQGHNSVHNLVLHLQKRPSHVRGTDKIDTINPYVMQ